MPKRRFCELPFSLQEDLKDIVTRIIQPLVVPKEITPEMLMNTIGPYVPSSCAEAAVDDLFNKLNAFEPVDVSVIIQEIIEEVFDAMQIL